jgi:predicted P-loop ATPase/GTPase
MTPRRASSIVDAVKQTAVVAEETAQTASPTPAAAASNVNVVVIVVVAKETASEFQLDRRRR